MAVFAVGVALLTGANAIAANSVTIASVEPGAVDRGGDPALNVTVDGPPAELRVVVVAPAASG